MRALIVLLVVLLSTPAVAAPRDAQAKRFNKAADVVAELAERIPPEVWRDTRCATVLSIGKGGFIVGGTAGWGVVSCREKGGKWSAPVPLDVGGPTVGVQIGGASVQVLMVFVDVQDIEDVVHATPVFQGSAQATAGPASAGITAGGNPGLVSGVMSVSKGSGLYAGATWEGLVIKPDSDDLASLYDTSTKVADVLVTKKKDIPDIALPYTKALTTHDKD